MTVSVKNQPQSILNRISYLDLFRTYSKIQFTANLFQQHKTNCDVATLNGKFAKSNFMENNQRNR